MSTTFETVKDTIDPRQMPQNILQRASWLGVVSGMRSTIPVTLLTWSRKDNEDEASANTKRAIAALATVSELILTKQPSKKSKGLTRGIVAGRIATGAVVGAILCHRHHHPLVDGAIRGAIGASIGAILAYMLEELLPQATPIPRFIWTWVEDGLAFWIGNQAVTPEE